MGPSGISWVRLDKPSGKSAGPADPRVVRPLADSGLSWGAPVDWTNCQWPSCLAQKLDGPNAVVHESGGSQ